MGIVWIKTLLPYMISVSRYDSVTYNYLPKYLKIIGKQRSLFILPPIGRNRHLYGIVGLPRRSKYLHVCLIIRGLTEKATRIQTKCLAGAIICDRMVLHRTNPKGSTHVRIHNPQYNRESNQSPAGSCRIHGYQMPKQRGNHGLGNGPIGRNLCSRKAYHW